VTTTGLALLGLGALHGINPGMGWLFAVGLGLQERDRGAVWRALPPLALGHALAIALAIGGARLLGEALPVAELRWVVAVLLVLLGTERLLRGRHPRWVGMRVGFRDLTLWSGMMATAHGAGLMVVPFVIGTGEPAAPAGHVHGMKAGMASVGIVGGGMIPTVLHTLGYLLVACTVAVMVYEKLGLRLLGRMWINLDLIWGAMLIATGVAIPIL